MHGSEFMSTSAAGPDVKKPCRSFPFCRKHFGWSADSAITYERGENCEPVERLISPFGLVAKGSVWYLVGAVDGHVRTYRVSRISQAEVLDEAAPIPDRFQSGRVLGTISLDIQVERAKLSCVVLGFAGGLCCD